MSLPDLNFLKQRKQGVLGENQSFKSAVFMPLLEMNGEPHILFEKRAADLKVQPGEICFPGGAIEQNDASPAQAAIRETSEELKISCDDIELVAPLDIMVSPFNAIVYPFVGYIKNPQKISYNPSEVDEIFYVPLQHLIDQIPLQYVIDLVVQMPEDYPYELVPGGKNYPYRTGKMPQHFYFWQDRIIWGMTARILHHFLWLLKSK
jgi:8-oxo-dGTP pyrophosphatase MutT (NUDIX family)